MELFQDAVVTLIALAAIAAVARRVFGFARARQERAGCAGCASGEGACGGATQAKGDATVHPVVLIRPNHR
jgi:hypothetical protein